MLNINKQIISGTHELADIFGLDRERVVNLSKIWIACQRELQDVIESSVERDFKEGQEGFDARETLAVFFKHFSTQELQDIALMQYLMQDIVDRTQIHANAISKKDVNVLLNTLRGLIEDVDPSEEEDNIDGDDFN